MAYHTTGTLRRRVYSASNHSSSTAAAFVFVNRCRIAEVYQAAKVNQTAAGSWTASLNGTQITGLSSVAVTTGVAGVQVSNASPTVEALAAKGDVFSVVGSSVTTSNWTVSVVEF